MSKQRSRALTPIPNEVIQNPYLDPVEFRVYVFLASLGAFDEPCSPSISLIAKRTGLSRRGVIKIIARLEETGVVRVQRSQERERNRYLILPVSQWGLAEAGISASLVEANVKPQAGVSRSPTVSRMRQLLPFDHEEARRLYDLTAKLPEDRQAGYVSEIIQSHRLDPDQVRELQAIWQQFDQEAEAFPGLTTRRSQDDAKTAANGGS